MSQVMQAAKDAVDQIANRYVFLFTGTQRREITKIIADTFKPLVPAPQAEMFDDEEPTNSKKQAERVLAMLKHGRSAGVSNLELNRIGFRYGARIWDLRKQGYKIRTVREAGRVFRFIIAPENW